MRFARTGLPTCPASVCCNTLDKQILLIDLFAVIRWFQRVFWLIRWLSRELGHHRGLVSASWDDMSGDNVQQGAHESSAFEAMLRRESETSKRRHEPWKQHIEALHAMPPSFVCVL